MTYIKHTLSLFFALFIVNPLFASSPRYSLKEHMFHNLDHIQESFSIKYAPLAWKQEYKQWNLDEEIALAKAKLHNIENPTIKEFQCITKQFFQSTADYHVGVRFYSTERADLPFEIATAEGRYFIVDIDYNHLAYLWGVPFQVGDELLSFDDIDIDEAIQQFKRSDFNGGNTAATDHALATIAFTHRSGAQGHNVPQGKVKIVTKSKAGKIKTTTMTWDYCAERIGMPGSGREISMYLPMAHPSSEEKVSIKNFFNKMMVTSYWNQESVTSNASHALGARQSFLPPLGSKIWKNKEDSVFDAYIFKSPKGVHIGYVRIPHYSGDEEEAEEFRRIIEHFNNSTKGIVIDQLNNPGGSAFYVYALLSMLTDKPLYTPKHKIALTQSDVYLAVYILDALENVRDMATAQVILGETLGGYVITQKSVTLLKKYCQFIIDEWNRGHMITDETYLFGIDDVDPHPKTRYAKPILLLINELDFSCGDFFPAIMQDNKRATILGTRTAGAGGYVLRERFYNLSGIESFSVTGSLAKRKNGDPLENLGIEPDIELSLTAYDIQNNYVNYKKAILSTLDNIVLAK